MKKSSLLILTFAAGIASGCGARTSDDELLDYSSGVDVRDPSPGQAGGSFGSGGSGTGGGGPGSNCCIASDNPGCMDLQVAECVCLDEPSCCTDGWSEACVARAVGCGDSCGAGGTPGSGGADGAGGTPTFTGGAPGTGATSGAGGNTGIPGGDCCSSHGGRGCQVPTVSECVCDQDAYCCDTQWDATCAGRANLCGASCDVGGTGGGAFGTGGAVGTGGAIGSGGGTQACTSLFPGECGECACNNCFDELSECLGSQGCIALFTCQIANGCDCAL